MLMSSRSSSKCSYSTVGCFLKSTSCQVLDGVIMGMDRFHRIDVARAMYLSTSVDWTFEEASVDVIVCVAYSPAS
eukprot:m.82681 g.82681  ORF g.82681 m.82681 type:complete len:75 (-) comp25541_c0_seq2:306-530(-)